MSQRSEELRLCNLVLEIDNLKPRLESGIFNCISWLNGSYFEGWWLEFSERRSQDLSNCTNVASWFANFFSVFTSIVNLKSNGMKQKKKKKKEGSVGKMQIPQAPNATSQWQGTKPSRRYPGWTWAAGAALATNNTPCETHWCFVHACRQPRIGSSPTTGGTRAGDGQQHAVGGKRAGRAFGNDAGAGYGREPGSKSCDAGKARRKRRWPPNYPPSPSSASRSGGSARRSAASSTRARPWPRCEGKTRATTGCLLGGCGGGGGDGRKEGRGSSLALAPQYRWTAVNRSLTRVVFREWTTGSCHLPVQKWFLFKDMDTVKPRFTYSSIYVLLIIMLFV